MINLNDYRENKYSQFGEDGITSKIFEEIEISDGIVGEVGAYDGLDCSNVALYWRDKKWSAILCEGDVKRYKMLLKTTDGWGNVERKNFYISQYNQMEIFPTELDLLSLDIDGDEWFVLYNMPSRPKVIVVEFNQSIPWWMEVRPANTGGFYGSSGMAMTKLLEARGYTLVAVTECNLIFLRNDFDPILKFATNYDTLFKDCKPMFLTTDYSGKIHKIGRDAPWGIRYESMDEQLIIEEE